MLENFDKDYLKQIFLRVAAFIGSLLLALYIGYQIWHSVTSFVTTEVATPFTVTEKSSGEGYIFRDETVISSSGGGSLVPSVDAGEKVAVGSEVAKIYSYSAVETESRISEIDRQIAVLSSSVGDGQLTNMDVSKLDTEVYSIITEMKKSIASGDYSEATAQRSSLLTKINKRNVASGSDSDISVKIQALRDERSTLTQKLGQLKETIYAPSAGWYYPETDGYEAYFTFSQIDSMTYNSFKELIASSSAQASESAGKMISDCKWYFVCEVELSELDNKKEGEEYTLYFINNQSVKIVMTLEKICESDDKTRAVAVYTTEKIPTGFDFTRMQNYEILENEYTGFRVPKSAVRIVDGQMGVYVLTGEVVHFRKISPIAEYDGGYIVEMEHDEDAEDDSESADTESAEDTSSSSQYSWLALNENIIIKGKGLREGRIITNPN